MVLRQIEGIDAIVANSAGKSLSKIVLTHRAIEAMKPGANPYRVPDVRCPGLAIRVAPSGIRTWDVAFRIRGASGVKRKALGAFPAVGLDDARARASALLCAAQAGRDLLAEEDAAKAEAAARMTVGELIDEYLMRACGKLRTRHEIKLRLKRALVSISDQPAETVRRREIRTILNATSDRGAPREAEKQRQSIGAMFAFAVAQDICPENPVRGLQSYSSGEYRDRILSPNELKTFWDWLPVSGMAPDYLDALRLQLCFGSRIGEAAGIEVSEIDQKLWLWTLPAARSKNKRQRVTPIIGLARDIIAKRLERTRRGPLFVNERGKTLKSNDVGSQIVNRRPNIPIDHFVSHDLRRTVATALIELGIAYDLVAAVLGHEVGDKQTRTLVKHYVRSDLLPQKRLALEAWDRRLCAIFSGELSPPNVVSLDLMRR